MSETKNPFVEWRREHNNLTLDSETETHVQQWVTVNRELFALFRHYDNVIEPWLKKPNSLPEPNLVHFIAGYGYSRTVTGNWKVMPIEIPEGEFKDWDENSGLFVTLEQLHDYQAGVAGSVAEMLGANLKAVVKLITKQLDERYAELEQLVAAPLTSFAPTQWTEEEEWDEDALREIPRLDRIFDLYEELWCFEQGIEELRMLMITEDDEEFRLPNNAFYDALLSIDSHKLVVNLERAEPRLREVLKLWSETTMHYSGRPYHRPYDQNAPEVFWWRHRQAARSSRQNGQRPPRRNSRPSKK